MNGVYNRNWSITLKILSCVHWGIVFHYGSHSRGALTWKGGTGDVQPSRPSFHASPAVHKTPSLGKSLFTRPSFERKMWHFHSKCNDFLDNFQLQKLKFDHPQFLFKNLKNIRSKAPALDENPLTSPHFDGNLATQKPPSSEIRAAHTYQKKKSWVAHHPRSYCTT